MIERLRRNNILWYQGPMIVCAAALFIQSSIPGEFVPKEGIFSYDKVIHFFIYIIFSFTVHRAILHQTTFPLLARHHYVFTVLLVSLYGGSDELHQSFVPGRSGRLNDWVADTLGVLAYVGFHWILSKRKGVQ